MEVLEVRHTFVDALHKLLLLDEVARSGDLGHPAQIDPPTRDQGSQSVGIVAHLLM